VQPVLGKLVSRPTTLDKSLIDELMSCLRPSQDQFDVITATTMCALDFYEGTSNIRLRFGI